MLLIVQNEHMTTARYSLELTTLFDSSADVTFRIEPPVRFLTEEARVAFGQNIVHLIARRAGDEAVQSSRVEITHDSADGTATIGYARVPILRYGTGEEVFKQAVLVALNGEYPDLY